MCLSQCWCALSLWYGAGMVDAMCLTIYSHTGPDATQTKQCATVAIRQALLGSWWWKQTIRALFVYVFCKTFTRVFLLLVCPGPCTERRVRARHRRAPWGLHSRIFGATSRTKWVNSVWHVFNMVTLEQAAFDWKANIQAMQIINHGKRSINYSLKPSNSRINVEEQREGWGGSQQRGRESGGGGG